MFHGVSFTATKWPWRMRRVTRRETGQSRPTGPRRASYGERAPSQPANWDIAQKSPAPCGAGLFQSFRLVLNYLAGATGAWGAIIGAP